jgi:hypothetical protein
VTAKGRRRGKSKGRQEQGLWTMKNCIEIPQPCAPHKGMLKTHALSPLGTNPPKAGCAFQCRLPSRCLFSHLEVNAVAALARTPELSNTWIHR